LQTFTNVTNGTNKTWTKTLTEPDTYTVSLKVTDANGSGSTCVSTTATWRNVAPTVTVSNNGPKNENEEITYTANATDA
jgi:hypothetical protein